MKVSDYLSRDEVVYFTRRNNWRAWAILLGNWSMIAAIFFVVAIWPNPLFLILAVILLAGRQMGLAVLMHDCGHGTFFNSRVLNDFVGQWLCALPIMNDQPSYARGHLEHHRQAGTQADPDLSNYQAYPISRESFKRKVIRDLTGRTGYKLIAFMTVRLIEAIKRGDHFFTIQCFLGGRFKGPDRGRTNSNYPTTCSFSLYYCIFVRSNFY